MAQETKWDEPVDARTKGGDYPNYWTHKSPSGHVISLDDSKGAESVTIQHRSGSMVQMHPDGSVVFKSHKGRFDITFGDGKMLITGDYDVTVNGGGSLKVEGDYDVTVAGNMHTVVSGDMETVVGGNKNLVVNGNQDTAILGSQTTKVSTNTEHTSEGKTYIGADVGIAIETVEGSVRINSENNVMLNAANIIRVQSESDTTIVASQIHLNP